MSEELLNYLIEEVNKLELNQYSLELQRTKHEGCWSTQDVEHASEIDQPIQ